MAYTRRGEEESIITGASKAYWTGLLAILAAAALWGCTGTVTKFFLNQQMSPFYAAQVRLSLAAIFLFLWFGIRRPSVLRIERQDLPMLALLGIGGLAGLQLTYLYTVSVLNVALAVFIQYLSPVIVAVYNRFFDHQPLGKKGWLALALAMAGSALMILGPGTSMRGLPLIGFLAGLGSAFANAFYTIYGKKVVAKYSPWTALTWALFFGALPWFLVNPLGAVLNQFEDTSLLYYFIYLALFGTALPFGLYFIGLSKITASETVIISMSEPLIAALTAYLFLGELLTTWQLLGGGGILLAVLVLTRGKSRASSPMVNQESYMEQGKI